MLILATSAFGQYVPAWETFAQCGPGGCYPPGGYWINESPQPALPPEPRYEPRPPKTETPPAKPVKECDCAAKWKELEAALKTQNETIAALQVTIKQQAAALAAIKIPGPITPQPATLNFLADDKIIATATITPGETTDVRLPPFNIRVQDPRGAGYSTNYQPVQLGQYVTLPFGPAL